MKRFKVKLYSYHSFLVVPFVVLFLYGHNIEQARLSMVWRTLFVGLLFSCVLFAVCYPIFRSRLKTGVYVTLFTFGVFQYGVIYDVFERLYYDGKWPFSNIHRYLVVAYLLILATLLIIVRRSKDDFIRINYFLNVLLFLLVAFNLVKLLTLHGNQHISGQKQRNESTPNVTLRSKPNIYYIILDGYASGTTLRKRFNFGNSAFESAMKHLGFRFCDSALANYYYTNKSLCSTLNMDFVEDDGTINARLSDNKVMSLLHVNGYTIYHLSSGYAVTEHFAKADVEVGISGPNEFEKSIMRHTILRLDDLMGITARTRLSSQFERIFELAKPGVSPKFSFAHIVAPHPPFVFDSLGRVRTTRRFAEHGWEPKEYYVEQLVYVNKIISRFLTEVRANDPGAIILVQSDHGPWVTAASQQEVFEARSGILNAYFAPEDYHIPNNAFPVNTFRYLFNYLGADLPLMPDSLAGKRSLMQDPILLKKVH